MFRIKLFKKSGYKFGSDPTGYNICRVWNETDVCDVPYFVTVTTVIALMIAMTVIARYRSYLACMFIMILTVVLMSVLMPVASVIAFISRNS